MATPQTPRAGRSPLARYAPLIAVGGGSMLVPDAIAGVSEVHRPDHFDVANAIGAAIASVAGEVDRIVHLGEAGGRDTVPAYLPTCLG